MYRAPNFGYSSSPFKKSLFKIVLEEKLLDEKSEPLFRLEFVSADERWISRVEFSFLCERLLILRQNSLYFLNNFEQEIYFFAFLSLSLSSLSHTLSLSRFCQLGYYLSNGVMLHKTLFAVFFDRKLVVRKTFFRLCIGTHMCVFASAWESVLAAVFLQLIKLWHSLLLRVFLELHCSPQFLTKSNLTVSR